MRRSALSLGGWLAAVCVVASAAWACSSGDTNPFGKGSKREQGGSGGTDPSSGGTSGTSAGTDSGGTGAGGTSGTSGASSGGEETGGTSTGGASTGGGTGDGGAAAEAGNDTGGTATGGMATGGTPSTGGSAGAGMGGSGGGGAGAASGSGGAGAGGAGSGGMSGSGGMPGDCKLDTDCDDTEYCKKASCDAESGRCTERGPDCHDVDDAFDPVCGCDGITYWNTCVAEHEGYNVATAGECTGNNRPTCTRAGGGGSCPPRLNARCYRPVEVCGDPSPTSGVCWVLPEVCRHEEPQTERYCGGTDGEMRCIGLCEVIQAENSFRRDAPVCAD